MSGVDGAGKVWLVGGGPGDPGLLTLRGAEVLAAADVVLYDRLAGERLLEHARSDADLIFVGKAPGRHALTQAEINAELVRLARAGKRVVRLKGGDPFVFGRGGEEAEALAEARLPFEIVPGVSSAIAGPAYAGIPVTHRGAAASFAVVTGHEDPEKAKGQVDWRKLTTAADTLVVLMGVGNLEPICAQVLAGGRAPETPAALIEWATTPRQRCLVSTLAELPRAAAAAGIGSPAIVVIGEAVRLRERLQWWETRPLWGRRVLVTRTRQQASGLRRLLEERGAEVIELPALEIVETVSPALMRRIGGALNGGDYGWVVFTSANGVELFFRHLREHGRDARSFRDASVCAIGPGTAQALAERGILADLVPEEYVAEGIIAAMQPSDLRRRRVLVPRAENARPELVAGLRRLGAEVEEVPLYVSRVPATPDESALARVRAGEVDVVTLASSSTVTHLLGMLGGDPAPLRGAVIACIGPVTANTARRLGLRVDVVAETFSIPGLVTALEAFLVGPAAIEEHGHA
ncbi:MAG TPA: uroporphyrinogen-III C-methyltransferase [Dehalococcoidia bacterium]|nr:uroporphyrinogen-III C-methyltransferase [Dehalococcoidia bacterium]